MATIQIKHIGPIKDTGVISLTTVMLIIGRQSSGKSTFLKILCFCRWLEKLIMISNKDVVAQYTHNQKFFRNLCAFHRFDNSFFSKESYIHYQGETIDVVFEMSKSNVSIIRNKYFERNRHNSKLTFIPSERNLVSAISNIDKTYKSSERDVLFNYLFEWEESKAMFTPTHPKRLSVAEDMEYVNDNGLDFVKLVDADKVLPAHYASSGIQSAMPIDVMVDYFTSLVGKMPSMSKHDLTTVVMNILRQGDSNVDNIETLASNEIKQRMSYQSVQLFIEEPEQNLYPVSQKSLLINMIQALCNAMPKGAMESHLFMTTHSPYVLSVLNVLIAKAHAIEQGVSLEKLEMTDIPALPLSAYSAYFITPEGTFKNIIDDELPMVDGTQLDGVSDWVDNCIETINEHLYG